MGALPANERQGFRLIEHLLWEKERGEYSPSKSEVMDSKTISICLC